MTAATGTDIARKIVEHKSVLTRKQKAAGRDELRRLTEAHAPEVIKTLAAIVKDKKAPANAKVQAGQAILDRYAGKPKFQDEKETEASQLEKMTDIELVQYICDIVPSFSTQARAAIAQSLIGAERGFTVDARDMLDEGFNDDAARINGIAAFDAIRPQREKDSAQMIELNFPSRERWLAQRGHAREAQVSSRLLDYASLSEVAKLKSALSRRFRQLGEELQGEELRYRRQEIRQALRAITNGRLPLGHFTDKADKLIEPLRKRYDAALERARAPIEEDDEAWRDEEARRADLQAKFGSVAPENHALDDRVTV